MFFSSSCASPLGTITLASDGENLVGLWLEGQKYFAAAIKGGLEEKPGLAIFHLARKWLTDYFAGKKPPISRLPLTPSGSEFRKAVWGFLCEIPYGQYTTYGEIAQKMAGHLGRKSMSSQAVGGAVGRNPISIIIPCHRVVGAGGNLTGYAGGLVKKAKLLKHEGLDMSAFFIPRQDTAR